MPSDQGQRSIKLLSNLRKVQLMISHQEIAIRIQKQRCIPSSEHASVHWIILFRTQELVKSRKLRRQVILSVLLGIAVLLIIGIAIAVGLSVSLNKNKSSNTPSIESLFSPRTRTVDRLFQASVAALVVPMVVAVHRPMFVNVRLDTVGVPAALPSVINPASMAIAHRRKRVPVKLGGLEADVIRVREMRNSLRMSVCRA